MKLLAFIIILLNPLKGFAFWPFTDPVVPTRVVTLYGEVDAPTTKKILSHLKESYQIKAKTILLINSPGGMVIEGKKIIKAIDYMNAHGNRVTCINTGITMSTAANIYLHCPRRQALTASQFLWHNTRIVFTKEETLSLEMIRELEIDLGLDRQELIHEFKKYLPISLPLIMKAAEMEIAIPAPALNLLTDGKFLKIIDQETLDREVRGISQ